MSWEDRITIDTKVLAGKPVIAGTRISVELLLDLMAAGWSWDAILVGYPQLAPEDLQAAAAYAAMVLKGEQAYPVGA